MNGRRYRIIMLIIGLACLASNLFGNYINYSNRQQTITTSCSYNKNNTEEVEKTNADNNNATK